MSGTKERRKGGGKIRRNEKIKERTNEERKEGRTEGKKEGKSKDSGWQLSTPGFLLPSPTCSKVNQTISLQRFKAFFFLP